MTERSYFHNGVGAGDAREAPYDLFPYQTIRSLLMVSGGAFVFGPDAYGGATPMLTSPNAGMVITVAVGTAYVYGIFCSNAAENFTIPANTSGMPRIDRLVLRVRWGATPSAALGILTGVPNTIPIIPALTQLPGDLYEMPIARIYVPSGLAAVTADYIIDEREFIGRTTEYYANENLMPNSEFMAQAGTSGINGAAARGYAPAYWQLATTNTVIESADKFPQMERGSTCKVTCGAVNDGLQTTVRMLAGSANIPVTIRLLIEVIKGEVWIDTAGGGAAGVRVPVCVGPTEVILRRTFTAADPDLELWIYNVLSTETIFKLGQVTVAHGLVGAPYTITHETIIFNMSPNMSHLDIFSGFPENLSVDDTPTSRGISAWIMTANCHDDASLGATGLYVRVYDFEDLTDYLRVEVGNNPDQDGNSDQGFVGVTYSPTELIWGCKVAGNGTSVANFTASVGLLGCVT